MFSMFENLFYPFFFSSPKSCVTCRIDVHPKRYDDFFLFDLVGEGSVPVQDGRDPDDTESGDLAYPPGGSSTEIRDGAREYQR